MTKAQIAELKRIQDLLLDITDALEGGASSLPLDAQQLAELRVLYAALGAALRSLVAKVRSTVDGMEYIVIGAVRRVLAEELGPYLAAPDGRPPTAAECASMAKVCQAESSVLTRLVKLVEGPELAVKSLSHTEPLLRSGMFRDRCIIDGNSFHFERIEMRPRSLQGFSWCLLFMRESGIRTVQFENTATVSTLELTWLCNAARALFDLHLAKSRLVASFPICAPLLGKTLYAHFTVDEDSTVRIRFESNAITPKFTSTLTVAETKEAIRAHFKLRCIDEVDGVAWTTPELLQVHGALAKLPKEDRAVLEGCALTRKKKPKDSQETIESGSYAVYSHTIFLLHGSFPDPGYGFVGEGDDIGPHTHWVVVHEVGHALEMREWKAEYDKLGPAALDAQIAALEQEQSALLKTMEAPDIPIAKYHGMNGACMQLSSQIGALRRESHERVMKQIEISQAVIDNKSSSICLRRFVDFVSEHGIEPITPYAVEKWPTNHGEFFADAYAMFVNEPQSLTFISPELFGWFSEGKYRV